MQAAHRSPARWRLAACGLEFVTHVLGTRSLAGVPVGAAVLHPPRAGRETLLEAGYRPAGSDCRRRLASTRVTSVKPLPDRFLAIPVSASR